MFLHHTLVTGEAVAAAAAAVAAAVVAAAVEELPWVRGSRMPLEGVLFRNQLIAYPTQKDHSQALQLPPAELHLLQLRRYRWPISGSACRQ